MSDRYAGRGVSAGKEDVHYAIQQLDKGLYPKAFCKILPDLAAGDADWCNIMHADGAGTKTALAYLYWKDSGDLSVWRGIAQDAIVMNTDDMLCAGATDQFLFSNTIGRNKFLIPKEVLSEILAGMEDVFGMLGRYGIGCVNTGGETADVGDLVRSIIYDVTAFARLRRAAVIPNDGIRPGSVIVGLASYGQSEYESAYNSGIGSNGLTNARHDVLDKSYAGLYPESYDAAVPESLIYSGSRKLSEIEPETGLPIGKLLLSPTRTYLPLMKPLLAAYRERIHGLIHCTGGGQTKVMKFVENLEVVKDRLFPVPPLFQLIRRESGASWQEMYTVFNMGHRLEIYTDESTAPALIRMAEDMGIAAQVVGYCRASEHNRLVLAGPEGELVYGAN